MSTASTVPGALGVIYGYLETLAADNPTLNLGVFYGWPTGRDLPANFVMLGSYAEQGDGMVTNARTEWVTMPANRRSETYDVNLSIVAWSGNVDPPAQITTAYSLVDGLYAAIEADPRGSGALSPSGSWGEVNHTVATTGPFSDGSGNASGWGVVIEVSITVINVRLSQ